MITCTSDSKTKKCRIATRLCKTAYQDQITLSQINIRVLLVQYFVILVGGIVQNLTRSKQRYPLGKCKKSISTDYKLLWSV